MKLAVVDLEGVPALALVNPAQGLLRLVPERIAPRGGDPLVAVLRDPLAWQALEGWAAGGWDHAAPEAHDHDLAAVRLHPPLRPGKIICLASNYKAHMDEAQLTRRSDVPWLFTKPDTSVIGPDAPITLPWGDATVDWEVELCAIIGRTCHAATADEALDFVAGYTIGNDVSLRSIEQMRPDDSWDEFFTWLHGKWYDSFTPLGPWMVTQDEMRAHLPARISLTVDGQVKQEGITSEMIFDVATSIAFISSITTLNTGDVVMTGTPSGVGAASGTFLKVGDVVEATIDGIGRLRNPVGPAMTGGIPA